MLTLYIVLLHDPLDAENLFTKHWRKIFSPYLMFIFKYALQPFTAYCAIWVMRSNFRHQVSPRVSPLESTQRRKVELWVRNVREFCQKDDFHVTFRDLLHAVKLYFLSKGSRAEDFFALKIRRFRPSANPRTWVPKASTLPLDHRSRLSHNLYFNTYCKLTFFLSGKHFLHTLETIRVRAASHA
jgi:hypothetical protein